MKNISIINGQTSIVLIPESDMDKLVLAELERGEITVKSHSMIHILDKACHDVCVLSVKPIPQQQKLVEDGKEKPLS